MNKRIKDWDIKRKEQKKVQEKEDKEKKLKKEFLQEKFNEQYGIIIILLGFPISILLVCFIVFSNVFNDGVIRFFLTIVSITILVSIIKAILFAKIEKEGDIK